MRGFGLALGFVLLLGLVPAAHAQDAGGVGSDGVRWGASGPACVDAVRTVTTGNVAISTATTSCTPAAGPPLPRQLVCPATLATRWAAAAARGWTTVPPGAGGLCAAP